MKSFISVSQLKKDATTFENKGEAKRAARIYVQIGKAYEKKSDWTKAFHYFEKAIAISPESLKLYLYLATLDSKRGCITESKQWMNQFCRLASQKDKFFGYKERVDKELENFPDLLRHYYEYWLTLDRTEAQPFVAIALCFQKVNRKEDCIRWFIEALKSKDKPLYVLKTLKQVLEEIKNEKLLNHLNDLVAEKISLEDFITLAGPLHSRQSVAELPLALGKEVNLSEMIQNFEKDFGLEEDAIDLVSPLLREFRHKSESILSQDDRARIDLALGFFEMELYQVAAEELAKVTPQSPLYYQAQNLLMEVLIQQGQLLQALEKIKNLLKNEDVPASIRLEGEYKLVGIYYRLGDREKAMVYLKNVEAVDPQYRDVPLFRIKLKR